MDETKYVFISNFCSDEGESVLQMHENGVSNEVKFSLESFSFLDEDAEIFMHCEVRICDSSLEDCTPSCARRRRRSANDNLASMRVGPIPVRQRTSDTL